MAGNIDCLSCGRGKVAATLEAWRSGWWWMIPRMVWGAKGLLSATFARGRTGCLVYGLDGGGLRAFALLVNGYTCKQICLLYPYCDFDQITLSALTSSLLAFPHLSLYFLPLFHRAERGDLSKINPVPPALQISEAAVSVAKKQTLGFVPVPNGRRGD